MGASTFIFITSHYPTTPGCYLMKDAAGRVLYVGKAKNLRRRLASYFRPRHERPKIARLVAAIHDIELILVNSEIESLILENNLIKRHKPRYNSMLVDDKSGYAYIVLTDEPLPRFVPYRKHRVNKALEGLTGNPIRQRFGPFVGRNFRDVLLDFVNDTFLLRTCHPLPSQLCLRYEMHRCGGVCAGQTTATDYLQAVAAATAFLSRQQSDLIRQMKRKMAACADRLEFERAQRIKQQVTMLEQALARQIVERYVPHDQAVVFVGERQLLVATIERGVFCQLDLFACPAVGEKTAVLTQHLTPFREILTNEPARLEAIVHAAAASKGRTIHLRQPQRGTGRALLQLCQLNFDYRTHGNSHHTD